MNGKLGAAARLAAALAWLCVIVLARFGTEAPVPVLQSVAELVTSLTGSALRWIGIEALRAGTVLEVPGVFAYDVTIGCTGLLPAAVLIVAIVASPGSAAAKRRGLLVGVPLVLAVNLVRLVHLFYLGIQSPRLFGLAHSVLWEAAIVLFTFAVWMAWMRWDEGRGTREGGRVPPVGDQGLRLRRPLHSWISG